MEYVKTLLISVNNKYKLNNKDIKTAFEYVCKHDLYEQLDILIINYYYVYEKEMNKYHVNTKLHDIAFKNNSHECINILIKHNIYFLIDYHEHKKYLQKILYNNKLIIEEPSDIIPLIKYNIPLYIKYDYEDRSLLLTLINTNYDGTDDILFKNMKKCIEFLIEKNVGIYEEDFDKYPISGKAVILGVYNTLKYGSICEFYFDDDDEIDYEYILYIKFLKILVKKKFSLDTITHSCYSYQCGSLLTILCMDHNNNNDIKILLEHGSNPNIKSMYSPIVNACTNSNISNLKTLIKYGANINNRNIKNKIINECLDNVYGKSEEYIKYLILNGLKYQTYDIDKNKFKIIKKIVKKLQIEIKSTFFICILHKTSKHTVSDFFKTNPGLYKYIGGKISNYIV